MICSVKTFDVTVQIYPILKFKECSAAIKVCSHSLLPCNCYKFL